MNGFRPNRWVYMVGMVFFSVCAGFALDIAPSMQDPKFALLAFASALAIQLMTYPMGAIGSIVAMACIYSGFVTVAESYVVAAPFFALAGMLQWYIVFPRIFGNQPKALPSIAAKETNGS